jgi:hypothetical protein
MVERLDLNSDEFVERMVDFADMCLEAKTFGYDSLCPGRERRNFLKRRNLLSTSLSYCSLYDVDGLPLEPRGRYLDIFAYFGF